MNYSEYTYTFDTSADAFGECSSADHTRIASGIEARAANAFPGLRIVRGMETKATGPDEDVCYDIADTIGRIFADIIESM